MECPRKIRTRRFQKKKRRTPDKAQICHHWATWVRRCTRLSEIASTIKTNCGTVAIKSKRKLARGNMGKCSLRVIPIASTVINKGELPSKCLSKKIMILTQTKILSTRYFRSCSRYKKRTKAIAMGFLW